MHTAIDSFSRSPALDFVRSPALERGHPDGASNESVTVAIHNRIVGYHSPSGPSWLWYPRMRLRVDANDGGFKERVYNFFNLEIDQDITDPEVVRDPDPFIQEVAESPGFGNPQLSGGAMNVVRTATTCVATYAGPGTPVYTVTRTLEGTPVDISAHLHGFWTGIAATINFWPVGPANTHAIFHYGVNRDLNSIGLSGFQPSILRQPQARVETRGTDISPQPVDDAFRTTLELRFYRRRNVFNAVGEGVNGAFGDLDFDGISTAIDCTRAIVEPVEFVIPPIIPAATRNVIDLGQRLAWLATTERRLIPPDAAHPLITC